MDIKHSVAQIEEVGDEKDDFYSNDDIFDFNSWGADLSFRELIQQYKDEDLLKPEIQRHYVWDKTEASRFIESILLGLPIPSIFLAKQDDEKLLIIDGYQRIKSVYDFVTGIFSGDGKTFKLTNSKKINERWRGKSFIELSDTEQRRINKATIHSIIFAEKNPRQKNTGMYQVFERINTSGKTLFPQEIRNCVYQGKLNSLLIELNDLAEWRELIGSQANDSRMRDVELILRAFTLMEVYINRPPVQTISLKKELNEFMGDDRNSTFEKLEEIGNTFRRVIPLILNNLGNAAFHNLPSEKAKSTRTKFNPTVFDSIFVAFATSYDVKKTTSQLQEARTILLREVEFMDLIRFKTTDITRLVRRFDLAKEYLFGN